MTLQQIDDALAAWTGQLAAIADNLLWLQNESTYQMIAGSGGAARVNVTGATAARVQPVLAATKTVFSHFDLLHSTVERAAEIRKSLPTVFGSEQKIAEIQHLLFGKSIQLPAAAIPAGQRSLLTGAPSQCLSPDEVLQPMAKAFAEARDVLLAIEQAWQELAQGIDRAESQIRRLDSASGVAALAATQDSWRRKLDQVREQLATDPFGALEGLNRALLPELAAVSRTLEAAERTRHDLLHARAQLDGLLNLHRDLLAEIATAQAKIADWSAAPAPVSGERLDHLREWLEQLERRGGEAAFDQAAFDQAAFDQAASGLRHWTAAAEACAAQDRSAIAATRATLEQRRELRGRLDALKAKARARGVAENGDIATRAHHAEALLALRPTHLASATAAVAAYASALNAAPKERESR